MKARIKITLKTGVLDPQGKAIQNALGALGFAGVDDVRQGKYIEVDLREKPTRRRPRPRSSACAGPARQHRDRELQLRAVAA